MRRKLTFIEKIKVFRSWLRDDSSKSALVMTCECCDSVSIEKTKDKFYTKRFMNKEVKYYGGEYRCRKCGAVGSSTQGWFMPKS